MVTNSSPPISTSRARTMVCCRPVVFSTSELSAKKSCQQSCTASCSVSGEGSGYSDLPQPCLHPKIERMSGSQSGRGKTAHSCIHPYGFTGSDEHLSVICELDVGNQESKRGGGR